MKKIELTKEEIKWVLAEIGYSIEAVRTDGVYDKGITFDKKNFSETDYQIHQIKMLSELYAKLGDKDEHTD